MILCGVFLWACMTEHPGVVVALMLHYIWLVIKANS